MTKYFYQYFQILFIFTYDKSLMMKSYQLFKFYERFYEERERTLIQQSMRIKKLRKVRFCVITSCFIKPFKLIIIFSSIDLLLTKYLFVSQARSQRNFCSLIRMTQETPKREIGNGKFLGMANCNIYFKTNFNLLTWHK